MSDTPLTDAAKIACGFQAVPESFFQHACQLERKNAALRAEVDKLHGALALGQENCDEEYDCLREERDNARAEATELRVDKARLAILIEAAHAALVSREVRIAHICTFGQHDYEVLVSGLHYATRAAIDAAMEEVKS